MEEEIEELINKNLLQFNLNNYYKNTQFKNIAMFKKKTYKLAYKLLHEYKEGCVDRYTLSDRVQCTNCDAYMFPELASKVINQKDKNTGEVTKIYEFKQCCNGWRKKTIQRIKLSYNYSDQYANLFTGNDPTAKFFQNNIRFLNNLYAFISNWHQPALGLKNEIKASTDNKDKVTMEKYYRYLFHERPDNQILFNSGRLLQEYICDSFIKVCTARVKWYKDHQKTLMSENYSGLKKEINKPGVNLNEMGTRVILPAGFVCSKRYWHNRYLDNLAVTRKGGKFHILLTITNDAHSMEADNILGTDHIYHNRPDICNQVFWAKFKEL
jgi:hypothetical protein